MYPHANGRRYVGIGLAVMFVLVGVAALVWALTVRSAGSGALFPFGWGFGFLWFFVLMWMFFGLFARPWRWRYGWGYGPYGPPGWRRWSHDPAVDTLRERYARGELTKEQFDRMMQDLDPHQ